MRAGEKQKVGALRLVMSELQKAAKEGSEDPLAVLRRERKRRLEAARAYSEAGREDLAPRERAEAELIGAYLPAQLSEAELQAIVDQAVRDSGAESMKDMGRVMKQAMAAVDGRADGQVVSGLVRNALRSPEGQEVGPERVKSGQPGCDVGSDEEHRIKSREVVAGLTGFEEAADDFTGCVEAGDRAAHPIAYSTARG